jgi:hypothetical protein
MENIRAALAQALALRALQEIGVIDNQKSAATRWPISAANDQSIEEQKSGICIGNRR